MKTYTFTYLTADGPHVVLCMARSTEVMVAVAEDEAKRTTLEVMFQLSPKSRLGVTLGETRYKVLGYEGLQSVQWYSVRGAS